jgi:hypothetical protein
MLRQADFRRAYLLRAEVDLSVLHGTFVAIQKFVAAYGFERAAEAAGPTPSPAHQWVRAAENHWPETLARFEYTSTIAAFAAYAQALLTVSLMARRGEAYAQYFASWDRTAQAFRCGFRPSWPPRSGHRERADRRS